jgi:hypothetical protein
MVRVRKSLMSLLGIALLLLLGACTRDMNYVEMKALMPAVAADKGRIYFYRQSALLGNLVTPAIDLNDESVGVSNPGAFFYVDRAPGDYQAVCGQGPQNTARFSLAAGGEVYVQTNLEPGGIVVSHMQVQVAAADAAIPRMRNLRYAAPQ